MILFLTGYRGSGKSTIAPLLSDRLQCPCFDTDQLVVTGEGVSIAEIFSTRGEPAFRELETQVIEELVAKFAADASSLSPSSNPYAAVVSLGGGAIMTPANRRLIARGRTVFLNAPAEVLWSRISSDHVSEQQRPDLTDDGGLAEVRAVLADRLSTYTDCADYSIETTGLSPEEIADAITRWACPDDK